MTTLAAFDAVGGDAALPMRSRREGAVLAILVLAMAPASRAGTPSCPAGFEEFTEYRLFFGRSRGDVEVVSDKAWRGFLAAEITPRFPDGLTVLDAAGQWRDGSGGSCGRGRSW